MVFANPLYLWSLLGLLIPISIHLWSKKEGKTIKVGSIKNLKESDSKQSSSIKLNELLLLFLRLLFITIISIILAEPYFKKNIKNIPLQYVVESSLFLDTNYSHVIDSLKNESTLLLADNFPYFNEELVAKTAVKIPDYWQLATQMESIKADSIVVLSYAFTKGVKGFRPEVDANINWVVLESKNTFNTLLKATKKENNIELLALNSGSKKLSLIKNVYTTNDKVFQFNTTKDSILITLNKQRYIKPVEIESPLTILINSDEKSANNVLFIKAALQAISEHIDRKIHIEQENKTNDFSKYDAIISLSNALKIDTKKPLLTYRNDPYAKYLIEKEFNNNRFYLTRDLNTELSVKYHLAEQLLEFLDLHKDLNLELNNKTQLSQTEIQPKQMSKKIKVPQEKSKVSISNWLWLFAILILAIERGLAFYRKQ